MWESILLNKLSKHCSDRTIIAGARSSPLSRAQLEEVAEELSRFHADWKIAPLWMDTLGDKDQKTSLRSLDKTDFFTRELDELLLRGGCRIAVHSAKDLPSPIPKGLKIAAVTRGVDPADALVFRTGARLETLPAGAKIATSSQRREEMVKQLRPDLTFIDVRGTIGKRLSQLEEGKADGVVVAEAALIRLKLTHLNRMLLPGETAEGQGRLAVVAREDDQEMLALFAPLDTRERILHLGLRTPLDTLDKTYIPFPIIQTIPKLLSTTEMEEMRALLPKTTHWIFTSQTAVDLFFQLDFPLHMIRQKVVCAVGEKTAGALKRQGATAAVVAKEEYTEGLIECLESMNLKNAYFFWPHSALSRPVLSEYCTAKGISLFEKVLYETTPLDRNASDYPENRHYDTISFTSPSTVDAFLALFGAPPRDKIWRAIGPITEKKLASLR